MHVHVRSRHENLVAMKRPIPCPEIPSMRSMSYVPVAGCKRCKTLRNPRRLQTRASRAEIYRLSTDVCARPTSPTSSSTLFHHPHIAPTTGGVQHDQEAQGDLRQPARSDREVGVEEARSCVCVCVRARSALVTWKAKIKGGIRPGEGSISVRVVAE